jgi:hypothetical protein
MKGSLCAAGVFCKRHHGYIDRRERDAKGIMVTSIEEREMREKRESRRICASRSF